MNAPLEAAETAEQSTRHRVARSLSGWLDQIAAADLWVSCKEEFVRLESRLLDQRRHERVSYAEDVGFWTAVGFYRRLFGERGNHYDCAVSFAVEALVRLFQGSKQGEARIFERVIVDDPAIRRPETEGGVILASAKTLGHSPKARLVVRITEVRS
jgi:hypothetical protein